jgi:hypothetical protein
MKVELLEADESQHSSTSGQISSNGGMKLSLSSSTGSDRSGMCKIAEVRDRCIALLGSFFEL